MDHMRDGHNNWVHYKDQGVFVSTSFLKFNTNEHVIDQRESVYNTQSDGLTMILRRCSIDYRNLDFTLSCGGCGVCMN